MSGRVSGWVLSHGPGPATIGSDGVTYGTAKARAMRSILLVIADAANHNGENSYPGFDMICEMSLYAGGTARKYLADLEADGWVIVTSRGGGRGRATTYKVPMDDDPPEKPSQVGRVPNPPDTGPKPTRLPPETRPVDSPQPGQTGDQLLTMNDELLTNDSSSPTAPDPVGVAFAAFYAKYPRKIDPRQTEAKYRLAVKHGANPATIDAGLDRWLAHWRANGTADEFIKHPAAWLNGARWLADPPRSPKPTVGPRSYTAERDDALRATMTTGRITDL